MGLDDALHIPKEEHETILARYSESERATRAYGSDLQGEGSVFVTPVDNIRQKIDPATLPEYVCWLWAVDFSHAGMSASAHPFAAVLLAHDPMTDVVLVVHAVRMHRALPALHVQQIKSHVCWDAPVSWPHDGARGADLRTGENFATVYKKLGLNMRPTHATFRDGGFALESGIAEMEARFATGRLKVASHLNEVLDEYVGYHRVDGLIHKIDDDLLSAIRVGIMDLRYAKPLGPSGLFRRQPESRIAQGSDFDLFTGQ
jgi:hypothetical protein